MGRQAAPATLATMLLALGCFDPAEPSGASNTLGTFGSLDTTVTVTDASASSLVTVSATEGEDSSATGDTSDATGDETSAPLTESTGESASESSGGGGSEGGPLCGDGNMDPGETCDDANRVDTDDCTNACEPASCGDGRVHAGVEECDDGGPGNTDACLDTCVAAICGDGYVYAGMEACDDGNVLDNDACVASCVVASCGDGHVQGGVEACDDGNPVSGDGCSAGCVAECGNPGGGSLTAENGAATGVSYCYEVGDSVETRALKACESHFGIGACCLIPGGYSELQYGACGGDGYAGTIHWHPDAHPEGHCDPLYTVGDVVSPGWCGVILGNYLD